MTQEDLLSFDESVKVEKYLAIKELLRGLTVRDAISIMEYATIQIKKDTLVS